MKFGLTLLLCALFSAAFSQDTLKVHFLYGSKPAAAFKSTEKKWFGGKLGGHVGIEGSHGMILNFLPSGKFHWFGKRKNRHSRYALHSPEQFYNIFGTIDGPVKKSVIYVPVTKKQKQRFDDLSEAYLQTTPYDYAFVGMRCGAATYEILGQLDIMKKHSIAKTSVKIFYPRKLRKRLFKLAEKSRWPVEKQEGTATRKWEKD